MNVLSVSKRQLCGEGEFKTKAVRNRSKGGEWVWMRGTNIVYLGTDEVANEGAISVIIRDCRFLG